MREPSIRASRLAIAGGLAAAIVFGGAGFLIGRTTAPRPEPAPVERVEPAALPSPAGDVVLGRADLIALAQSATDAVASGPPASSADAAMAGRRFDLVLPFGCGGPAESGPMRWQYDQAGETLRITVEPTSWPPSQWQLEQATRFEVAEGFWISRPWSSSETCPRDSILVPQDGEAVTLPGQTLAIAQFFTESDNRNARRDGKPFELVKRAPAVEFDGSRGFVLRVTGRIDRVPGHGPIHCVQPAGAQQRPLCVIAARIDEVAVENPATGEVIGSWRLDTPG